MPSMLGALQRQALQVSGRGREGGRGRERERETGRERGRERGRLGIDVLTLMYELSASYMKASWWMVDSCMARIGQQGMGSLP